MHLQQFASIFNAVRWIGPLFVANAAVCLVSAASLAGIAISASALAAGLAGAVLRVSAQDDNGKQRAA